MLHRKRFLLDAWPALVLSILVVGCAQGPSGPPPLAVEPTLHLEEHLAAATIEGAEIPPDIPDEISWRFAEGDHGWTGVDHFNPDLPPPHVELTEDALRLTLSEEHRDPRNEERLHGDFYVALPDLKRSDWSHVLVQASATENFLAMDIGFNLRAEEDAGDDEGPYLFWGDNLSLVNDGTIQTYQFRADWHSPNLGPFEDPWKELAFAVNASDPASLEIVSITLIPKAALYKDEAVGVRTENLSNALRRTMFAHVPARLDYRLNVPEGARLDVGLGLLRDDIPVTFRVAVTSTDGTETTLFEETYDDDEIWAQRSIDLAALTGSTVDLALEADADSPGTVAFWAAPTIGTSQTTSTAVQGATATRSKPNVIFYVLDGGGADYMSVYGYNRRTTPNMERLAEQGAVFERAHSNSSWSKPSTTSFMTSLHNSVLGNTDRRFDPLPVEATTMAEHFHHAGYRTAVFTSNSWAASMSNLDRGVDVMREHWVENDATSSAELHQNYWDWRQTYPGSPYWVHFQSTDNHAEGEDADPGPPFNSLFLSPGEKKTLHEWQELLDEAGDGHDVFGEAWEKTGISRTGFFELHQRNYDQIMTHQDYQIGRLVDRLEAIGEWENTLLIIAADHSTWAGSDDMGIAVQEVLPERWKTPIFRSSVSRVPLIFIWPAGIEGGQRINQTVSLIDVLPTVLDLVGLPQPEVLQGQSLVPLMTGKPGWEPRPVIFDQFEIDRTSGQVGGLIEVIDGRWGASLWIGPELTGPVEAWGWGLTTNRPTPLLLYDLWNDPMCLTPVHEEHPDLVEKYNRFLQDQYEAHQALASQFTAGEQVALTPEQLETLRSLGYIQ